MKAKAIRVTLVWLGLMLIGLLFADSSYARIDPQTVAGLWLFDEGDGDVAEDSSGNGNHGTIVGNADWVDGKFGSALEFDGSSHVSVNDSESLDMTDQVTVMFWVRTEKKMADMWNDRQAIVGKHYLEYEVGIYMGGQLHTYTNDGTGGGYDEGIMASIGGKLPDKDADWELGKWYHIAWTLNGQHEIAYVNGIKIGEHNKAHADTMPGTNPLEIGRRVGGSIPLTGAVDEVIVINVALEEEDIQLAAEQGLERALGIAAVSPAAKFSTTWAAIKAQ
jgi:hypothetical protein